MLAIKVSPQLDIKQRTLLEIAINLSNRIVEHESTSIHISQIKDYQIWRNRTHVALVNNKTQKLIVFGTITLRSSQLLNKIQNIVSQGLWKNIHQYYGLFSPTISEEEINSAWHFLRVFDRTI